MDGKIHASNLVLVFFYLHHHEIANQKSLYEETRDALPLEEWSELYIHYLRTFPCCFTWPPALQRLQPSILLCCFTSPCCSGLSHCNTTPIYLPKFPLVLQDGSVSTGSLKLSGCMELPCNPGQPTSPHPTVVTTRVETVFLCRSHAQLVNKSGVAPRVCS